MSTRSFTPPAETKGVVERANGYLGTSFLPGRAFCSPVDFNTQLADWLNAVANVRRHASTRLIPAEALIADRAAMATLPPVAPATATTVSTRLGRDYYVTIGSSAYSVHPEVIGRMITVTAGLNRVQAHCGDRMVADHQRLWGAHGLASDPAHVAAASILRHQYLHRRTGTEDHLQVDVEVADLSAYDAVFGTGEVA